MEQYTTLDVYQAGFLILKGFAPTLLREEEKIVFSFELSPHLLKALLAYQSGDLVRAVEFTNVVKTLKGRVFAIKREYEKQVRG